MANLTNGFGLDSVQPVKSNDRTMNLFSTFSLWLGANVVVTTVLTGMFLVPDLTFLQAMFIILVGSLLGAIPLILTGNIGTRTGLPTMILTRGAFGHYGAVLPSAVNMLILIGWTWIQAYMAGLSLNHAVEFMTGYSNVNLFTILTEIAVVAITIYGHRGIEKMENIIASSMLVLSVIVFGYMFITFDVGNLITMAASKEPAITAMIGFDIVVATAFSWMPTVCDFNRYCSNEKTGMLGTYFGYVLATVVAMGLGATVSGFSIMNNMEQTYDPTVLIGQFNPILGFVAAIVIFFSVLSTNVMALYSAVMSYLVLAPKHRFWIPAIILGIISIIGALLKDWLMDHFFDFVLMIATLFIPVIAVMLVDYYIIKKEKYDPEEIIEGARKQYWYHGGINVKAYLAYIIGAIFAYFFTYKVPLATGSTIITFFVTASVYYLFMKIGKDISVSDSSGHVSEG
ncbi:MAG: cytosine permease [Brevibacillus sp.]|nr:cytosine permease [Brevibacillus sp.]